MTITDVFDAALEGDWGEFLKRFDGDVTQVDPYTHLNLMMTCTACQHNPKDRLKIMKYLIRHGIDVNFVDRKGQKNALHLLFFNCYERDCADFLFRATKMLVKAGINVNALDKYSVIPLNYAITVCKVDTQVMANTFRYLIKAGSDYLHVDVFHKTCLDYATEFSWRNDILNMVKEYEKHE